MYLSHLPLCLVCQLREREFASTATPEAFSLFLPLSFASLCVSVSLCDLGKLSIFTLCPTVWWLLAVLVALYCPVGVLYLEVTGTLALFGVVLHRCLHTYVCVIELTDSLNKRQSVLLSNDRLRHF